MRRPWSASKLSPLLALTLSLPACAAARSEAEKAEPAPVSVFAELDGTWEGTFVGYDPKGVELYRIAVTQTYETVDDTTQSVAIVDRMPDGTVIRGTGVNVARRGTDGALELSCDVRKSNGERVQHLGRVVRGPDGHAELVWYSAGDDRVETFREAVVDDAGTSIYAIHGMGRYGEQLMLMAGRYRKVTGP